MGRKTIQLIFAVCIWMPVLSSCEHRILTDPLENHYIRVYLDEQIKNVTYGFYNESYEKPEYSTPVNLRVTLSNPNTGEVVNEKILRSNGADERGKYIDGHIAAQAGTYNLIIHEVGSSVTRIGNQYDHNRMYAYTDIINDFHMQFIPELGKKFADKNIAQQPEHLFHDACGLVTVKNSTEIDTLWNNANDYFTARSITLSYYFQVKLNGIEWITSAAAVLGGMAGSSRLDGHRNIAETDPINLFFTTNYADKKRNTGSEVSTAVLYATFNTFGKIGKKNSTLTIEFLKTDGSSQIEEIDITDMFNTPFVTENQWILLEKEITITKPENTGGMKPGVEMWKDIETDVVM